MGKSLMKKMKKFFMKDTWKNAWIGSIQHLYHAERPSTPQLRKLGLVYSNYRVIISLFLALQSYAVVVSPEPVLPSLLQQTTIGFYVLLSFILLGLFYFVRHRQHRQLVFGLTIDVIILSMMLYTNGVADIQLTMLYMVVVAASFMLLTVSRAFIITLLAIIFVVYQQFLFIANSSFSLSNLSDALLMSSSFLGVGFLSWSVSQRLVQIEKVAEIHAQEIEQLNLINQEVISSMVNGVMVIEKGQVLLVNKATCELLNLDEKATQNSLYQTHITNNVLPSRKCLKVFQEQLERRHPALCDWYKHQQNQPEAVFVYQVAALTKADISHSIRVSHTSLKNSTQLLILEDLSREQANAQQLKLASLGQLTASIAHEIRNPLAAISQASELLMEDSEMPVQPCDIAHCPKSDAENANYELYKMIFMQTKRVNRIIEDILSLSRQTKPNQQLLAIANWLENFLKEHFRIHDVFLHAHCQPYIHFDPNQLEQILINLINNGLRYSSRSHSHAYVEIEVYCIKNNVIIDILDNGEGVASQHIASLFDPFFTTDNDGTGLGLYLSQAFSEANHAKLMYVPEHEKTCFRLLIPSAKISPDASDISA